MTTSELSKKTIEKLNQKITDLEIISKDGNENEGTSKQKKYKHVKHLRKQFDIIHSEGMAQIDQLLTIQQKIESLEKTSTEGKKNRVGIT